MGDTDEAADSFVEETDRLTRESCDAETARVFEQEPRDSALERASPILAEAGVCTNAWMTGIKHQG